jgi:hypothetical protein
MNEDAGDFRFPSTPPVLLWRNGGRTAWGRMVGDQPRQPALRLCGEEWRSNAIEISILLGEPLCELQHD